MATPILTAEQSAMVQAIYAANRDRNRKPVACAEAIRRYLASQGITAHVTIVDGSVVIET